MHEAPYRLEENQNVVMDTTAALALLSMNNLYKNCSSCQNSSAVLLNNKLSTVIMFFYFGAVKQIMDMNDTRISDNNIFCRFLVKSIRILIIKHQYCRSIRSYFAECLFRRKQLTWPRLQKKTFIQVF